MLLLTTVLMLCTMTLHRYTDFKDVISAPADLDGTLTAALHMQHASAWMRRSHPVGVAGKDAAAKGAVIFNAEGEGLIPVSNAKARFQKAGKAINFVALRD